MRHLKTSEAALLLNVSPNTLRLEGEKRVMQHMFGRSLWRIEPVRELRSGGLYRTAARRSRQLPVVENPVDRLRRR